MSGMSHPVPTGVQWHKSSYSNGSGGECVEVATARTSMLVRDSKNTTGPVLAVPRGEWAAFVSAVRHGTM
ncbi:DUF397 domain-containing protein [Streptomyces sp. S07_1.15]|uniref:DUF397 domain-containing protein n=1 Tax=Streptomyces sp. S07_1.15 TaxID=2873925 RepID=UPI001D14302B|nr:DUF397 domain-containing protein [Streptomyces sp. S07_1.15]MCC3653717.1 DUF397 domain-containing protein [Streptomyces sp. S07_1.15]